MNTVKLNNTGEEAQLCKGTLPVGRQVPFSPFPLLQKT